MPKRKKLISHPSETSTLVSTANPTPEVSGEARDPQSRPTAEKTTPSQPATLEAKFVQAKVFASFYANHVYFAPGTLWDFTVTFGEVRGAEGKTLTVENRLSVTMPLAVAKMLALGIGANLQQYEKAMGKAIELPGVVFAPGPGGMRVGSPEAKEPTGKQ